MTSGILAGWKEICAHLKIKRVESAMRLADEEGLPVVRTKGGVYSSINAIEAWILKNSIKTAD